MCVENIDRVFLAFLASEGFNTLRESLQARITALDPPLEALSSNALIASNVDAHELNVRSLAGYTTVVLAYRFKVYSQRAAKDLSDVLFMHYEENDFASHPNTKYWQAADVSFSPSTVCVPLFRPPASSPLPHMRTALSTTLPPPNLNLTLTPGSHAQFSSSSRASSSHLTSPALFGHPLRLTEAANAAAALREQSKQDAHLQFPAT